MSEEVLVLQFQEEENRRDWIEMNVFLGAKVCAPRWNSVWNPEGNSGQLPATSWAMEFGDPHPYVAPYVWQVGML